METRIGHDRLVRIGAQTELRLRPGMDAAPRSPTGRLVSRSLPSRRVHTRGTVVSNDVARDSRYLTALASTGSELIVPVIVGDRVVGTLDVEDERTNAFGDDDRRLFERVADAMGPLYDYE